MVLRYICNSISCTDHAGRGPDAYGTGRRHRLCKDVRVLQRPCKSNVRIYSKSADSMTIVISFGRCDFDPRLDAKPRRVWLKPHTYTGDPHLWEVPIMKMGISGRVCGLIAIGIRCKRHGPFHFNGKPNNFIVTGWSDGFGCIHVCHLASVTPVVAAVVRSAWVNCHNERDKHEPLPVYSYPPPPHSESGSSHRDDHRCLFQV